MNTDPVKAIGDFFGRDWELVQRIIRAGVLSHNEMFGELDRVLTEFFPTVAFSFADFGCGDGTAVLSTLQTKKLKHYTGVDAASELITAAKNALTPLHCEKTLICQDMATAIDDLKPVDVIFCSYSLHHLKQDQKARFIDTAYHRLNTPGYLIIVDGVSSEGETRDQWLQRLDQRIQMKAPGVSDQDRARIMEHPHAYDYPETISAFRRWGNASPWSSFKTVVERDDFLAFMIFSK